MLKTPEDANGGSTRVLLHGPLGDMFGREHSLYISSPREAIRALCAIRDGFRGELARPGAFYSVLLGAPGAADSTPDAPGADSTPDAAPLPLEGLGLRSAGRDVHIVPVLAGAKTANQAAGWSLLAGAALLAVSIANPVIGGFALGAAEIGSTGLTVGGLMFGTGLSLAFAGANTLLSPSDTDRPRDPANDPSRLFNGAVNTVAQGHPIQICYGEMGIGSALVASMIDYTPAARGGSGSGSGSGGDAPGDIVVPPPALS
jgi:predicted phage tail protein